jgi:hypothetical protein
LLWRRVEPESVGAFDIHAYMVSLSSVIYKSGNAPYIPGLNAEVLRRSR